jgi:3-hydroxyacyl-[acyl-carrier-protein] dehydratase
MLIRDLYTYKIEDHSGQVIKALIAINEKSTIYEGHFPLQAITPGVCQVLMIKEILERELGTALLLSGAKNIKFTAVHEPGKAKEINARISYEQNGNRVNVDGWLYKGETVYLKFRGEFTEQA